MKKLMIAAAIVCVAAVSQAGYVKWNTGLFQEIDLPGTATPLASATAYLFDATTYSQSTLLDDFFGNGIKYANKQDEAAVSAGIISVSDHQTAEYAKDSVHSMYFAIVNGDNVFLSQEMAYTAGDTGKSKTLGFNTKDASQAAATTWVTGGTPVTAGAWYTAVPEPTSGLLLLLGVAGLALRRRRA